MYTALLSLPWVSHAQQAASGAALFQRGQQLEAAGNRAAAATTYQQAYAAYMSVDDSDGMIKALAKKKALTGEGLPPAAAAPAPAARPVAVATRAAAPAGAAIAAPLAGRVAGGKPLGLFFMTRYWIGSHSLEKAAYYFTPAGQAYQNPTGFGAADLAALPAGLRGSYTVTGNTLTIRWADGHTSTSALQDVHSNAFNWDTGIFLGVQPFANTQQLTGTFEGGNSISTSSGSAAVSSDLTFRADGTYSGGSASSFSGKDTGGNTTYDAGASGAGAGRWSLNGWVLTLTNAQGQTRRGVAFPFEMDDKTGRVVRFYFDNVAYKRL
ncbi:hypothetical protein [Hymenobacter baengnokdamensis]|uniref:hypothetical protein n=1 Tax=Hymenobacter baengnokdamensis TaxID=2615203 RepID=UPI00124406AB|nr:hypothetical protein [Hymenobacter baengnokdamensis]